MIQPILVKTYHKLRYDDSCSLNFNPSWTSVKDTPYEANKILCRQWSNFTLTLSRYTIGDLEILKGKHE